MVSILIKYVNNNYNYFLHVILFLVFFAQIPMNLVIRFGADYLFSWRTHRLRASKSGIST
jgi:hypothetical protein